MLDPLSLETGQMYSERVCTNGFNLLGEPNFVDPEKSAYQFWVNVAKWHDGIGRRALDVPHVTYIPVWMAVA